MSKRKSTTKPNNTQESKQQHKKSKFEVSDDDDLVLVEHSSRKAQKINSKSDAIAGNTSVKTDEDITIMDIKSNGKNDSIVSNNKPIKPLPSQSPLNKFPTATDYSELLGPFIQYNCIDKIPEPMEDNPPFLSLSQLNKIFLILCGWDLLQPQALFSILDAAYRAEDDPVILNNHSKHKNTDNTGSQIEIDFTNDAALSGTNVYQTLINISPANLYISDDSLHKHQIAGNLNINNLLKQADKYGDSDGYCGYLDFLNMTRNCGLWIDQNVDLYIDSINGKCE